MPKTPEELKAELEAANEDRPADFEGTSRTAEGLVVPNPSREDFFSNLDKVSKPDE